ncbi:hypothetical protein LP123_05190 [Moraxella bovis]|uniref:Uncharacterized protein n=1 Tax=Moraxella bovis TaxID=476 RepID=A0ABY6MAQ5_MORBO|nr:MULTISPECIES: hypothetical protein [Moraxella]UYZ74916.1 hypothetical protein LP093_09060 [Moraxella bovis]UYZ79156.1 hypothetical protein LP115_04805 [Moraxella bovis]UYZ80262.1 hypothetical protein LP113_09425 [Moraxella bovis]UYZ87636.1 hypothetical protein LP094_04810 [Moraxella bovis]UYZ94460.1 hypothetical protein LP121_11350 [Moraxella bovis]
MGLPKDKVKPAFNYTYPSERDYFDDSKSTVGAMKATDTAKSGGDYGIKNPEKTEALTGTTSETGKVE